MAAVTIPSDLKGMQWDIETPFGTLAGSMATLHRAQNINFVPAVNMHPVEASHTTGQRGPEASLVGGKGGTLTFEVPLHTMGGSESPIVSLARACGCTRISVAAGAGKVHTGSTTTTVVIEDIDIGNIVVGVGFLLDPVVGDSSIRFIKDIASPAADSTCTTNFAWGGTVTPAENDSWVAVDTLIPSLNVEPDTYMAFDVYQGQGSTDRLKWALTGCAGKMAIPSTDADGLPIMSFEFSVDSWVASAANLAQTTYAGQEANPLLGDTFYMDGVGVATKSVGFDPQFTVNPLLATSGANGREGWTLPTSMGKLDILPRHDLDLINTDWLTPTLFDATFVSHSADDDAWALWIPKAQILSYELGESEGIERPTMEIQATNPGVDADNNFLPQWALAITK